MGWARLLLLGNVGQQMDLDVHDVELGRLKEQAVARRRAFERIDHQVDAVRQENEQLRLALARVVRLLVTKNVLNDDDVAQIVGLVESSGDA
jgi:hypothetical protein